MKLNILCLFILGVLAYSQSSWDTYIDNLMDRTKDESGTYHCDKVAIVNIDDGAKLTTDGHANAFKLSTDEAAAIARCFKTKDFTEFIANGIYCEGVQYQFFREEGGKIVYARKRGEGTVTLQASKTAIVIAHAPEGSQAGNLNRGVAAIAEYLESLDM